MCTDYDPPDVWRSATRTARKTHRCGECGRGIDKGETYEVCSALTDGRWYGGKTCEHCIAARHWLMVVCSGYAVGGVLDDLREHVGEAFYWWDDKALYVLAERGRARWQRGGSRMTVEQVRALTTRALVPWQRAMAA